MVWHAGQPAPGRPEGRDHHAGVPGPVPGIRRLRVGDPGGRHWRDHRRGVLHAAVRHRRADYHRVLAVPRGLWVRDGARGVQQVAHIAIRSVHAHHAAIPGHSVPAGPARGQPHSRARRSDGRVRVQHNVRDATGRKRAQRRVQPVLLLVLRQLPRKRGPHVSMPLT